MSVRETLTESFDNVFLKYRSLFDTKTHTYTNNDEKTQELKTMYATLREAAVKIEMLSLFSPNEEIDDVPTSDMKYLLVPFMLAQTLSEIPQIENRYHNLQNAIVYWEIFLTQMMRLGVTPDSDHDEQSSTTDPAKLRTLKIEALKKKQEFKEKIDALFSRAPKPDSENASVFPGLDDEDVRELVLLLLKSAVIESKEQSHLAKTELPFLERFNEEKNNPTKSTTKPEPKAAASKPFVLRINDPIELRKLYLNKVFQPFHELPTISLAECAEIEMAQDLAIGANTTTKAKDEETSENEEEEMKARAWDDWKDHNPKGSGNTMKNVG